jgi:hypothetical protein
LTASALLNWGERANFNGGNNAASITGATGRTRRSLFFEIEKNTQTLTAARNAKTGVALGSDEGTGAAPVWLLTLF